MKKKYSGPQITNATLTVGELEMAVKAQADKVRQLKATTKDRTVWQPEVTILLDLKKQLTEAQSKQASSTGDVEPKIANNSN